MYKLTLIVVLLLITLTILLFNYVGRYDSIGPELIVNSNFLDSLEGWVKHDNKSAMINTPEPGLLSLAQANSGSSVFVKQVIKSAQDYSSIAVKCDVKIENIIRGKLSWEEPRVLLVSKNDSGKKIWNYPHEVFGDGWSNGWGTYEKAFGVNEGINEMELIIGLFRSSGSMYIKNLSVHSVVEKHRFTIMKYFLAMLWALSFTFIFYLLFWTPQNRYLTALLVVASIISIAAILAPHSAMRKFQESKETLSVYKTAEVFANNIISKDSAFHFHPLGEVYGSDWAKTHKMAHLSIFFILGLLTFITFRDYDFLILVIALIAFAASAETLQYFSSDRAVKIGDFLLNVTGVTAAILISMAVKVAYRIMKPA